MIDLTKIEPAYRIELGSKIPLPVIPDFDPDFKFRSFNEVVDSITGDNFM